jgi:hypothetical protein
MKGLLVTLAAIAAALTASTAPAAARLGPGDPFSTNCARIEALAQQKGVTALLALADLLGSTSEAAKIQTHFPAVTFTSTSDGGCLIQVNP